VKNVGCGICGQCDGTSGTYVQNGPLSATDPTGYAFEETVVVTGHRVVAIDPFGDWQRVEFPPGSAFDPVGRVFNGFEFVEVDENGNEVVTVRPPPKPPIIIRVRPPVLPIPRDPNSEQSCFVFNIETSIGAQVRLKQGIPGFKVGGRIDLGSVRMGYSSDNGPYITQTQGWEFTFRAGLDRPGLGWGGSVGSESSAPVDAPNQVVTRSIAEDFLGLSTNEALLAGFSMKVGTRESCLGL
jgi:hypothetical protein